MNKSAVFWFDTYFKPFGPWPFISGVTTDELFIVTFTASGTYCPECYLKKLLLSVKCLPFHC